LPPTEKYKKKIARVSKPAFINTILIRHIDMGDSGPSVTNPKLRELTIDGSLIIEADISYKGNFRIEIAAVARIELGSRFKAREVDLVLAGVLKKLEGHLLIKIKPPPSNRIWISFETMPKLDLSIEPIVSSRQITYGVILRAIESRIREVMGETIVSPNWDDIPFHDTMLQRFRGGIWEDDVKIRPFPDAKTAAAEQGLVDQVEKEDRSDDSEIATQVPTLSQKEKTMSMPSLTDTAPTLKSRKPVRTATTVDDGADTAASSGAEFRSPATKPKAMRSNSFASAAAAVVSADPVTREETKPEVKKGQQDAATVIKDSIDERRL